ncbi:MULTISPECIES: PoNe immunity protein domain-containing protein [unclassified Curtobacterium]|uniref:PoNe immunity protein domain-containing protein n=1 Tax=unclassified Curtobacterium TaxID=257496 RepID=UPI0011139061|nr:MULTISPECIES: PoNe immunity protein domain-containing protein [unclassified Curtobacterium]
MTPFLRRKTVLRQRAAEFDSRYWQSAIEVTSTNWEGRKAAAQRATDPTKLLRAVRGEWHMGLRYLAAQYSAGVGRDAIGDVAESVAGAYCRWVDLAFSDRGPSPSLSGGSEYYISVLRLLGITMGCGREHSARALLEMVVRQGADPLFAVLASASGIHSRGEDMPSTPQFARPLLTALEQPGDATRAIEAYLSDWPSRMRPMDWMGSLEAVLPGEGYGAGFFGYWALELSAIARATDVRLDRLRSPFLPVDLL